MAKLKSPLLSFSAQGTFGDVLVFFNRHGKSYARSKPKDPISLSVDQGVLRDCFVSAAISAHSLTEGQKDYYASLAPDSAFCPWWNNFIGQYIKDNYEAPSVATTFIKSVQIATGTIPDGVNYVDVVISSVDHLKTVPFILGIGAANDDPRNFGCYITFLDATHVRFVRYSAGEVGDLIVSVMVFEVEPDFLVSIQSVSIAYTAGDTLLTELVDEVDLSKAILFPRGRLINDNVAANIYNWYADMSDSTHVRIRRVTGGSAGNEIFYLCEFI
ncbi:MAG: hypothetical protein KAX15_00010 [Candidatus Omnitrophica bacterium]|nr:hypothetical protein [Candidatus Omnitrophota bacterium]